MNANRWVVGVLGALMLAGGGMLYYVSSDKAPASGIPESVFDRMETPKGVADMVGDVNGRICHELRLRNSTGEHVIGREYIEGKDFRILTPEQKRAAIIESAKGIAGRAGLMACAPDPALPFPGLASDATAQPHCIDCGGSCGYVSCPAHVVPTTGCQMQGPDCIIGIMCCTGYCNCW